LRLGFAALVGVSVLGVIGAGSSRAADPARRPPGARPRQALEELGRQLFNDQNLSVSRTQSCASCHQPEQAFTGNNHPDPLFPVAIGARPELIGNRNAPTAMYAAFIPSFSFVLDEGEWIPRGGQFWDGRADTLADQAAGPFINPREMAMPSKQAVVRRIRHADYADSFARLFGVHIFDDVDAAYAAMTQAIQAFEQTPRFSPFSSKFDAVLRGEARFTRDEARGFALFKDPNKGNCIACHAGEESSREPTDWLFTDFTYDNLGVPRNPEIPDNAAPASFDLGLCAQPGIEARVPEAVTDKEAFVASLCGAFKVPTLRNVAVTAPYMHNGYFKSLRDVVEFYVTRDTDPDRWYPRVHRRAQKFNDLPPEYQANVNTSEVPYDLQRHDSPHLSPGEIDQVVQFLGTLTDGYTP
jgi:cytochrome c peroxidase